MNGYDLLNAVGEADARYIEEANAKKAPARHIRWGALAACLAALALAGAGFGVAAEAKEYNTALAFFEENSLSAEGLSRADVKRVYRDITTGRFTLEETAQVITRAVPGAELPTPEDLTPEALEALWNRDVWMRRFSSAGFSYKLDYTEKMNPAMGFDTLEKSIVRCYKGGELQWTAEFPGFYVEGCTHTDLGTAVWGKEEATWDHALLARVDETGGVKWVSRLNHGMKYESVTAVLDAGDGTWAVISGGDRGTLCFSIFAMNGNALLQQKTELDGFMPRGAARLGEGYLVQVGNFMENQESSIIKLDAEGNRTDTFTYTGEDCDYYMTDLLEYGGLVYLSAYAVPKQTDEGGRHEIADILDDIFSREVMWIDEEELIAKLRKNYTAVLLLCDPAGGDPKTFYSVPGALGGALAVNDAGDLKWETQKLESAFFSPATNAFTIGGACRIVNYTFAPNGVLRGQETTDETVGFHR